MTTVVPMLQTVVHDLSRHTLDGYRAPDHTDGERWPGADTRSWTQSTLDAWARRSPTPPKRPQRPAAAATATPPRKAAAAATPKRRTHPELDLWA